MQPSTTQPRRSIEMLSYGLTRPVQLLDKLIADAEKLSDKPHPYDVFNFIVTAAVLAEWTQKYYCPQKPELKFHSPSKEGRDWTLPKASEGWIEDMSCLPNPANGVSRHIDNVLSICSYTANASKHYHWSDGGKVSSIAETPPIGDWYQYFFTSTAPDLYVTYKGENYGLQQVKGVLIQFYRGLLSQLEKCRAAGEA